VCGIQTAWISVYGMMGKGTYHSQADLGERVHGVRAPSVFVNKSLKFTEKIGTWKIPLKLTVEF
jgi:hypothetical protein